MSVTYTATLPVRKETVTFMSGLLHARRQRLGTRAGRRSLGCYRRAILVIRWLIDGTASRSWPPTTRSPSALLAAKMAGYAHVTIDGTLIETERCRTPGPTPGVDLWWSGKHDNHSGNVQVITVPHGWPLWTSPVRLGREHDTTALRARHPAAADGVDRRRPASARRSRLRRRARHHHGRVQETEEQCLHRRAAMSLFQPALPQLSRHASRADHHRDQQHRGRSSRCK
jgi:DDE superfamily endonuclease